MTHGAILRHLLRNATEVKEGYGWQSRAQGKGRWALGARLKE
jgi:hypothetical protein